MRILPEGHELTRSGRTMGLVFGIFSGALAPAMLLLGGGIIQASPFLVLSAVFLLGGFLSDYTKNKAAKPKIEFMEEMLGKAETDGAIIALEKKAVIFGKEVEATESFKAKNMICRFYVEYIDPYSGETKEAVSEAYSRLRLYERLEGRLRIAPCYDEKKAKVYTDGEKTWVELIYKSPNSNKTGGQDNE